jgi:hypothetical protein
MVRRADNLTTFMCRLSRNLGASASWNPQGMSMPAMELLYLTLPYFTLTYLTLTYLTLPYFTLPYLTLPVIQAALALNSAVDGHLSATRQMLGLYTVSPSTAALSHRMPASSCTCCDSGNAQRHYMWDIFCEGGFAKLYKHCSVSVLLNIFLKFRFFS